MDRRQFLHTGAAALLCASTPAQAAAGDRAPQRYAAPNSGRRPAVILLHGSRGFAARLPAYQRYTTALNAEGIDAYLLPFYGPDDVRSLAASTSRQAREEFEARRYPAWIGRVSRAIDEIRGRPDSSAQVGLLGFSLGGFVAAGAAARDSRVSAAAVLYGGMPDQFATSIKRMPPLLELHGTDDHSVPFAAGTALVRLAQGVGAAAEQVSYPGRGHGFDLTSNDRDSRDCIMRVVGFMKTHLAAA